MSAQPRIGVVGATGAVGTVTLALLAERGYENVRAFASARSAGSHVAFGDGVALLAGDALLAEALRIALSYDDRAIALELAQATAGMIGGQYRDVTGDDDDLEALHRLKTGALFAASVGLGLRVAGVPESEQGPWRAFGDELGLLFQVVDDVLDGDGYAARIGPEAARRLAADVAVRAHARLHEVPADTSVLHELVDELAFRTS